MSTSELANELGNWTAVLHNEQEDRSAARTLLNLASRCPSITDEDQLREALDEVLRMVGLKYNDPVKHRIRVHSDAS